VAGRKTKKQESADREALQESVIQALADPTNDRPPTEVEAAFELEAGTVAAWLGDDPLFRRRLEEACSANRPLERLSVRKSLAAKAKEGSIQHQKYYLEILDREDGQADEKLTVEFIITDASRPEETE